MVDVVLGAIPAPAGRQLHRLHIQGLVAQGGPRVLLVGPGCERALQPVGVVAARIVFAEMCAAAFRSDEGAIGDRHRELQHLLRAVRHHQLRIGAGGAGAHADIATAHQQRLQLIDGLLEIRAAPEDADLARHDLLHRHPQVHRGFRAAAREHGRELRLLALEVAVHHGGRDVDVVLGSVAKVTDELAHDHAGHDRLGHRVAAQAVEAMHVPAGRFARREQTLQGRALAGRRGAHATHGVVLGGAHRDPLLDRVYAKKVMADLVDLAQVVLDVVLPQQGDVEPEVLTEAVLGPLALGQMLFHAPRDHIARGQLLLLGLVVRHEAVAVDILE